MLDSVIEKGRVGCGCDDKENVDDVDDGGDDGDNVDDNDDGENENENMLM